MGIINIQWSSSNNSNDWIVAGRLKQSWWVLFQEKALGSETATTDMTHPSGRQVVRPPRPQISLSACFA